MVNLKNILLNKQLEGIQILIVELVRQVIIEISKKKDISVILVERSLENALICADYLSVIDRGTAVTMGRPKETACRFERHLTV